ncbi:AraD1 family protein [Prosthecomicrobium pneumaticum]|uniref:FAH family protein n=1 Tax=Prosthecomicrobium pneumaticum TaxID=81895 RepID=A0A7W9FJD6_9HYPH|nr:AraD1 family protein [Prosthecomicrobium pneumaticum]MBB5751602.1 hypothetical protein [Prosthecomicrobium pneumaticum]
MRLLQFLTEAGGRGVAALMPGAPAHRVVDATSVRDLALAAHAAGRGLAAHVETLLRPETVDAAALAASGRLLLPLDHPEPARTVLAITGLTHLGSAQSRDAMHAKLAADDLSDSMKMFKLGIEGGKPAPGAIGVQPEWAYKGDGSWAVPPGAALDRPDFAEDGGEEAEIAGLYVIAPDGAVLRVGFALGNEYSDHVMEQRNYLYLAHSKLRASSYGPELLVGALPDHVEGRVSVSRGGREIWSSVFLSGEANMCHSIANLEHHHFKYAGFRRPGDVHVYYYGASLLSFSEGLKIESGDRIAIAAAPFGLPLVNTIRHTADAAPRVVAL